LRVAAAPGGIQRAAAVKVPLPQQGFSDPARWRWSMPWSTGRRDPVGTYTLKLAGQRCLRSPCGRVCPRAVSHERPGCEGGYTTACVSTTPRPGRSRRPGVAPTEKPPDAIIPCFVHTRGVRRWRPGRALR
jgi:hypothetical protein